MATKLELLLILTALPCLLPAQTTVNLSPAPNPSIFGTSVVLVATVTPATATGRVTFYDGVTVLGTQSLASGAALLPTIALPAGSRKLRAYYAGAGSNAAATSSVVTQVVNARPSAGFATVKLSAASVLPAVADFNRDSKADLVTLTSNGANSTLTVLLGDGLGSFSGTGTTLPGTYRGIAAPADFNGDGKMDLALVGAAGLNILLGNGDGTFQPALVYSFPNNLPSLAVSDFNGDGIPDIALADPSAGVNILLGKGDGSFQVAVPYATNPQGGSVSQAGFAVVGDFNGDGKADLATANAGSATISILLGKGDGTFQSPSVMAIASAALSLATGDFNGDGKADLVTNNGTVLLGNGDGTFRQTAPYVVEANPAVTVADFNGDGNADLVFSGGAAQISLLYGRGDGTFQPAVTYPIGTSGSAVLVGDFNSDGKTDLVFSNGNAVLLLGTTVTVTPVGGTPQSTPAGASFGAALQVIVKDGANPLSGVTVTFTAPSGGASAALSSSTAVTDVNGAASVTATANAQTGSYTVTAAALGVPAMFSLANLSGTLSTLTATGGTPQQTLGGTAFSKPLAVKLTDSSGLPASGVPITFSAPSSGPSATFSAGTAITDASGLASVAAIANSIAGSYAVTARSGGLTATFALTNLQSTNVILGSSGSPVTLGAPLTLTANVPNGTATGRVTFFDGVNILGTKPIVLGAASLTTTALTAGSHKVTAYYRDETNSTVGRSIVLAQKVRATAGAALSVQTPIGLAGVPKSAVVADFNGDGKADIASPSQDTGSWWQVDLGAPAALGSITIWNRTDCCGDRLSDYWVFVSNTPFDPSDTPATLQNRAGTFSSHQTISPRPSSSIFVNGAQGQYVRVQLSSPGYLSLAEVQVFSNGTPAVNLAVGKTATQSSTLPGYASASAASAVDGNTDGTFFNGSVTSTSLYLVAILLGRGDGTFQPPVNYGAPSAAMASGDCNGDGNLDLVFFSVAGSVPVFGNVAILLGNGDGTFRLAVNNSAGVLFSGVIPVSFGSIVVGDFNGDGKADVVIGASYSSGSLGSGSVITLLPGNGDGTLGAPISYTPVFAPFVMADFNGDATPDLAGLRTFAGSGTNLSVTLGNGNGTGQPPLSLSQGVSGNPYLLVTGDFNGDGNIDLAVASSTPISGILTPSTFILLGKGDGTFQAPVSYPFGAVAASGDFNGDGAIDLVVADASGNTSGLLLGNGDGTFQQGLAIQVGASLAVADFNGDGRADILTASPTGVTVLLGVTDITVTVTATGGTPQSASLGTAFAAPLQVKVLSNGIPVTGAAVLFTVPTVGPSAVLSSSTATTNAFGVASVTAIANALPGSYVVTANYNGVASSFSLTNTNFASLTATGGTPQSTSAGSPFPTALQATVKNFVGSPVSGVIVTFSVPTVGPSATLSGSTAVTNSSGVANVTATANNIAGSYTVTAGAGALTTSFSLTNVPIPTAASITATGGTPQSTALGAAFATPLQATVKDANGIPLGGIAVAFTVPTVGASSILSSPTAVTNASGVASVTAIANTVAGSYSVTATVGTLSTQFALTNQSGGSFNLAAGKTATQSSTLPGTPSAAVAVDGNTDGSFFNGSVTATNADANAWWQVDLGGSASITSLVIWNRTDCCGSRLSDFWVFVSDAPFLATDTPATLQNRPGTFASHQTTAPNPSTTITATLQGRYVRVQLSGADYLSLAEVQVFGTGAPAVLNVAQGKQATQSSTIPGLAGAGASSAVDGNTNGNFFLNSVTATNLDTNAWWQVDLGASATISSFVIWNRTDCCASRLTDYWVFVSDTPFLATDTPSTLQNRAGTFASHQTMSPNPSTTIAAAAQGRYVRVQLSGADYLSLAEVQVFGSFGQGLPPVSNVSMGKPASQSSTLLGVPTTVAASAVDGNTDGSFYGGSVTATNLDANPWWQVDLGASKSISSVAIFNRTDCCGDRLSDYWVFVSDTPFLATDTPATLQSRAGTFASHQTTAPNPSTTITMTAQGRYVRVQLSSANYLSLAEVQVFGQ